MGKNVTKKRKISKAERRRAARRKRMIRTGAIYAGVVLLCVGCLVAISALNRPVEPRNTWYVEDGALEIAAPGLSDDPFTVASGEFTTAEGHGDDALRVLPGEAATEAPTQAPTEVPTEAPTQAPTEAPFNTMSQTITITATGDCTLGGSVHQDTYARFKRFVQNNGYDYFFQNVRSLFEADDLTILNLEGPITDVGKDRHGSYVFKGDPDYVNIMTGSSVELCNVANNHSQDFGTAGLKRTAELLEQAGIGCCGYSKVFKTTIKGVRITALGYLQWEIGCDKIVEAVKRERPDCDILIVNMHWGLEKHYEPVDAQKTYGHAIIDAGADLIIGTHPHVYGGIEKYKGKYIVYSLGNFCFGGNDNPSDKRALMFQQTFNVSADTGVTDGGINVIPVSISSIPNKNNYQPTIMAANDGVKLLKAMSRYSNFKKGGFEWMAGCYPEQVGLVTAVGKADAAVDAPLDDGVALS